MTHSLLHSRFSVILSAALLSGVLLSGMLAVAQSDADTLLQQARIAEKAGDYASAARVYHQALAIVPGNLEVLKRLGVLEQTELKFDDSIDHFRQVIADTSANVPLRRRDRGFSTL